MVKYKIKGMTCSIVLDLPKYMDESTKDVLIKVFGYCLDEESKEKVLGTVQNLLTEIRRLINFLKKSKKHTIELENTIREFLGSQVNRGFEIGSYYTPGEEEGRDLSEILSNSVDYGKTISKLSDSKKAAASTIFTCMDLAILAFETGLMLSYYLSEELVEQHQNELRKSTYYIG